MPVIGHIHTFKLLFGLLFQLYSRNVLALARYSMAPFRIIEVDGWIGGVKVGQSGGSGSEMADHLSYLH
jgi:hypothetical protein